MDIEVAVVGAGVTGLACARAIAARGLSVCVLESLARPGLATSTHNSGVIHAGIYYPADSLKARLCVEGRERLYAFCTEHQVPHRRCGKLVIAHGSQDEAPLDALLRRGRANGVDGLESVDRSFVTAREPHVLATSALYSRDTGILDAEALVIALARSARTGGAIVLPGSPLLGSEPSGDAVALRTPHETIVARQVINAAGLFADTVSAMLGGESFTIFPCRGEYAALAPARRHLVRGLVYPLPGAAEHGLGVHLIRTISGEVWVGPTAEYQSSRDDYEGNRLPVGAFVAPASRLIAGITERDLRLAGSGIRPKLHPPQEPFADFLIRRDQHNQALVHAAGIESPGLTSCLAIGQMVADLVG